MIYSEAKASLHFTRTETNMKSAITKSALLLILTFTASSLFADKGKTWTDEHQTLKDSETGYEYIRLTASSSDDSALYFTGNAYIPADNLLFFASKREKNRWQIFSVNLKNYVITQITDLPKVSATSAVVCAKTREVFFFESGFVKAVDLKTLNVRTIVKIPDGYNASSVSVTDDGKFLAFSISEKVKLTTTTSTIYSDMDEHFNLHPWSALMTGKADGTLWHEVARQQDWISHTMISPTNPNLILYCHEGSWKMVPQRLWLAAVDGSFNKMLRPEEKPEIRIGHEYWFDDGIRVGYHGSIPGKGSMVGIVNTSTGAYTEYFTPQSNEHTFATRDAKRFVGDGTAKAPYISLYDFVDGKLKDRRLVRHNSDFSRQEWHPHPRITSDGKILVFTSVNDSAADLNMLILP
jgi:oligogalacturonide lyase